MPTPAPALARFAPSSRRITREARGRGEGVPATMISQGAGQAAAGLGAAPRPIRQARRTGRPGRARRACRRCRQSDVTNRLTFARWLVDPNHPLTARVTVNRFWQQFFGTGLVKTARGLRHQGRMAVASRTAGLAGDRVHPHRLGREATGATARHLRHLPAGFAGHARAASSWTRRTACSRAGRATGWTPRCCATTPCSSSGLLNLKMGGRGVRPYQPPGIWEAVGYTTSNTAKYTQDHGDALYRRSLYLFWKRTAPPPS